MNFKNIFRALKNKEMLKRIGIVVFIIVVYRLLAQIPVPLGDATTFRDVVASVISSSDFGSFLDMISGGGLTSFSIILVGVGPFITASIVVQLMTRVIPRLEELSRDGESGRRKINQWTRILTVPLAIIQSIAYIYILYQSVVATGTTVVAEPTMGQWALSVTAMTAGSILMMWLGELIAEQGIGQGISILILASIVASFPSTMANLFAGLFDTSYGTLSLFGWLELPVNPTYFWILLGFFIALLAVIYILVKINEAQRIITINYAKRVRGNSAYGGIKSVLPFKLIAAGVIPVIFATALLSLPALIGQLITSSYPDSSLGTWLTTTFTAPSASNFSALYPDGLTAQWFIYPAFYFVLVVLFTYFYTSIIYNTRELADNLQKQGGFIEGVRPGLSTAKYLDKIIVRLNLFGSLALGLIAMLPFVTDFVFILAVGTPIGLSLSGTGILIVVTVALESLRQINSRALMVTYDEYEG